MDSKVTHPEFLRLLFTDILGHTRSIELGYDRLDEVLENGIVIDGSSVPGYASVNESDLLLLPSSATPTLQPWDPAAAYIICTVHEISGQPHLSDPRYILRRIVDKAHKMGYQLMVGSELEFFTVRRLHDDTLVPLDRGGYFSSQPSDCGLDFRRDIIRTLQAVGIPTTSHHHEVAQGQEEIGLQYCSAEVAADNILLARLIISEIAYRRGLIATFMPKPFSNQNGSGMHLHQSVWDLQGENNLFATERPSGISPLAMHFIGGLLEDAHELAAILAPTVNSYKRLVPGFEAPTSIAWGYRNRSTMIRIPHFNGSKKSARIEIRCPDPSSSPHLAIAVLLASGLAGIERKLDAPVPTDRDVYKSLGSLESLPQSLVHALLRLERSTIVRSALGENVVDTLVRIRGQEWSEFIEATGDLPSSEITPWEIERYLLTN
ncbi:MAG: glutamine synthetase [Candidatus Thorarchaeota archaeon]|nr:glutamine synthetase [Candidatus Thorarchaeota archaeon]